MVSVSELEDLKNIVIQEIEREFEKHLTGNLLNTIYVEYDVDQIRIVIPAETYNFYQWFIYGVVVKSQQGGSYASKIDKEGSRFPVYDKKTTKRSFVAPLNHKDWVERVTTNALNIWLNKYSYKYKVERKEII